jgi:hypothetical protein
MRHRGRRGPLVVGSLPSAMGLLACLGRLIALPRRGHLLPTHLLPTNVTAVALPAIATTAQGKHRMTLRVIAPANTQAVRLVDRHMSSHDHKRGRPSSDGKFTPTARMMLLASSPARVQKNTFLDDR